MGHLQVPLTDAPGGVFSARWLPDPLHETRHTDRLRLGFPSMFGGKR